MRNGSRRSPLDDSRAVGGATRNFGPRPVVLDSGWSELMVPAGRIQKACATVVGRGYLREMSSSPLLVSFKGSPFMNATDVSPELAAMVTV